MKIIGALHPMRGVEFLDSLQFNQKLAFDEKVREIVADHRVLVMHRDAMLLHNNEIV